MFKLSENFMVATSILKCDCIFYNPQSILSAKRAKEQDYLDRSRRESFLTLQDVFLEIWFDLLGEDDEERFLAADKN